MNTPRFRPTVRAGRENVARSVSSCTSLVDDTRIELDVPGGSRCIALCTRRRVVAHVAVEGVPSRRTSSFSVARVSTPPVFAHSLMRSYRRVAMNIRRSCASSSLCLCSSLSFRRRELWTKKTTWGVLYFRIIPPRTRYGTDIPWTRKGNSGIAWAGISIAIAAKKRKMALTRR